MENNIEILKTLWGRSPEGKWEIDQLASLSFKPREGSEPDFFTYERELALLSNRPIRGNPLAGLGTNDYFLKQSVLPVIAWARGDNKIRCIGTATVISCSGYLVTACHVLLAPHEEGFGKITRVDNTIIFGPDLKMGVLVPVNPIYNFDAHFFFQFQRCWHWGEWKQSPIFSEKDRFKILTDIAICKIAEMPSHYGCHQPLQISLNPFTIGEQACAFGYSEMQDIEVDPKDLKPINGNFDADLYISYGPVNTLFPENHKEPVVPTPGPCFDFAAKIPGKMSGGPILGADNVVIRGVVSRSFSKEKHAFGAMLGPVLYVPLDNGVSLKDLIAAGNEGIPRIIGKGL